MKSSDAAKIQAKESQNAKLEAMKSEIDAETGQKVDVMVEELDLTKRPMTTDAYHAYQENENGANSHFPFFALIKLAEKKGSQLTKEELLGMAGIDPNAPKSAFCGVCGDEVRFTQQTPKAFKLEKIKDGEKTKVVGIEVLENERGRFVAKDNPEGTKTEIIALCVGCEGMGRENPNNPNYKLPMSSYRQAVERANERNAVRREKTDKQEAYRQSYQRQPRQQFGGTSRPTQSFGPAGPGEGINRGSKSNYRR